MRALIAALLLAMVGPSLAAEIVVTDGDTLQIDRTVYRLDGIDAPEIDQTCLDQSGDVWACGVTARDRLSAYIGNRAVRCEDKGPDPIYKHRRIGICSIESEATTLNEWLVREGWAIKFEPYAKGRFAAEEADAYVRAGADCGKDVSQNRATCDDGISMERDLSAAVVKLAMRTEHATSYSASTPPCRQDARSRLSWRCGP